MNFGELLFGVVMVAASFAALWIALPQDGEVRPFLRNENAQAYYVVAILGMFALGMVNIVTGLVPDHGSSMSDTRPTRK
jgi:hypothetical protein